MPRSATGGGGFKQASANEREAMLIREVEPKRPAAVVAGPGVTDSVQTDVSV